MPLSTPANTLQEAFLQGACWGVGVGQLQFLIAELLLDQSCQITVSQQYPRPHPGSLGFKNSGFKEVSTVYLPATSMKPADWLFRHPFWPPRNHASWIRASVSQQPLNLGWPCDGFCQKECGRSDAVLDPDPRLKKSWHINTHKQ